MKNSKNSSSRRVFLAFLGGMAVGCLVAVLAGSWILRLDASLASRGKEGAAPGSSGRGSGGWGEAAGRRGPAGGPEWKGPAAGDHKGEGPQWGFPGGNPDGPGFRNPFTGRSADDLFTILEEAAASRDPEQYKLAAEALGALSPEQVDRLARSVREARDPREADFFLRHLARYGGKEGVAAIAELARDGTLGVDLRARAIEALTEVPPEGREGALSHFKEILASGLPQKLDFHAANCYGRLLGPDAAPGLVALLGTEGVRAQPIFQALRDFARPADLPLLTDLLGKTSGREDQEMLLKAIGGAAGQDGGKVLLSLLESPPEGVRRDAIGFAMEEFLRKEDLPRVWENLASADPKAQGSLARAIAHLGGPEEIAKLAELARSPDSGLSPQAFAQALSDSASKETVPLMLEFLKDARTWESAEPLARAVARIAGAEGIQQLLDLARLGTAEEQRRAIIQAIEDSGDRSNVDLLSAMLEGETNHGVAFHLAKAILRLDPSQGPLALAERLSSIPEGDQRAAIANVLEREGSAALIPALTDVLRNETYGRAQWHLARAMASLGPDGLEAVEQLISADAEPMKRVEMLRGLESVRPEDATRIARELLSDASVDVRRGAAKLLAASKDAAVRGELLQLLASEPDPVLREHLAVLLKGE
jgi:hypothetical protein